MLTRTLSTFGLWFVVILLLKLFGAQAGVWMIGLIAALTQREFYGMLRKMGQDPFDKLGVALGVVITVAPYYLYRELDMPSQSAPVLLTLAFALIVCCLRILREREPHNRVETLASTLFGLIYVPFPLHFLVRIFSLGSDSTHGIMLAVWLIAAAKFCDVGALLTGMAIGKHKMAPGISPKKTWEGAAGGLVFSALIGAGLVFFFRDFFPPDFTPLESALAAVPVAAIAIVSDLIESIIKRRAEVKDSSDAIPGIGGVFDLTDSLILTAPVGYSLLFVLVR